MKAKLTAAELMARLNADPKFVTTRAAEEAERQRRAAEWLQAETPLLEELRATGIALNSVWDLVNTAGSCSNALPILLQHLQRPYPGPVREGIARALAVPEARFGWDVLVRLYGREDDKRAKDGLAVAIASIADDDVIDDVVAFVRDARQGPSRLLLLRALEKSRDPRALATLRELREDPELQREIKVILRRLKRARRLR